MKNVFAFAAAVTLSTSVLAGNISLSNDMKPMHQQVNNEKISENILKNNDMQRLHREMKRYGLSEVGMEARLKMIGSEKGRAYHRALDEKEKNTAG